MTPNVIVLTNGLSGSSVLTGLIAKSGYWLGDETKLREYNTYENSRLVDLNIRILKHSGFDWAHGLDIPPPSIEKIKQLAESKDQEEYRAFISACDRHQPWLWKDPRLCYTIFFWKHLIDFDNIKLIIMERDLKQIWTGQILRTKVPIPLDKLQIIQRDSYRSCLQFVKEARIPYHELTFEQLILEPEKSLVGLSEFLGKEISMEEFRAIYRGTLYKKRWSGFDYMKARLKFLGYKYLIREVIRFPRRQYG